MNPTMPLKKSSGKMQKKSKTSTPMHVLLPIDFSREVSESTLRKCINVLKLLFPSDMEVHTVAKFQLYQNKKIEWLNSGAYSIPAAPNLTAII